MSEKLNIANEMRCVDQKDRAFYDSLTDEERKKFSNFLMIRWSSCVSGGREMQEYYVQSCNHFLNKHFFTINKHPKLQWLCATAISPGMGTHRHNWISPKKKNKGTDAKVRKILLQEFPNTKSYDLDVLLKINNLKDVRAFLKERGHDSKSQ